MACVILRAANVSSSCVNIINVISHQTRKIGNMDGQVKLEKTVVAISDI